MPLLIKRMKKISKNGYSLEELLKNEVIGAADPSLGMM